MGAGNSTEKKGRKDAMLDVTRVSSGFRSEVCAFTWKIENFDVVRQSKEQICAQKFEFLVGEKIELPCKMCCCLHYSDADVDNDNTENEAMKNWIGLYYNLVQAPETATNVNTKMEIEINNKFGQKIVNLDGGVADLVGKRGWGFPHVISQDAKVDQLPLIDGCLHIFIKFTIFAPNPTITDSGTLLRLRKMDNSSRGISRSLHNLLKDFQKLLDEDNQVQTGEETSPTFADVKILTKDQQVFKAHRAILSARSPVFEAMFRNNMLETQTGVVRIQDCSAITVKVLLQFIYTGTLPHSWHKADVVVELTNAAAKYELRDLLEYLDENLGSVCDERTAGKLLLLASRLNLAKAEKQILDYIKQHGVAKSKDFLSIVKNIAAPEDSQN